MGREWAATSVRLQPGSSMPHQWDQAGSPRYVEGLGSQGYGFETTVADLVDNSIDASTNGVLIHVLRDGIQLVS
jgi:hypothetical protein